MKKILLTGISMIVVAALAVGLTIAYLQHDDGDVNVMTLGNVKIEQHEYERVVNADGTFATDTIDNVKSYVLKDFTQAKPLLPYVGVQFQDPIYEGFDATPIRMTQVDSYGTVQVFAGKNAQDKIVTVENTGKTDAYVRTLVAIEIGTGNASLIGVGLRATENAADAGEGTPWFRNNVGTVTIKGVNYSLIEFVYEGAKLSDGSYRHANGVLPAEDTSYPSLCQVYIMSEATNEDCEALDGNGNGTLDILVMSQAVQTKGFDDAQTALDTAFGDITTTNHPWLVDAPTFNAPKNDAELEDALKDKDAKQIIVNLTGDVSYDVAAWANDAMGGEKTEYIMINGNGHTITFNQTNSDWNNIVTNGAKLIINNAKITNAGHNDGPWNRHDLNFACEVELNNVVSDKALAFKAGATLNNVTINDANTSDTYAIWIQPNGQTVTLNDCTIDMIACTDGRGIKIDEQYLGAGEAKKVTLNVSNTTFKTEEKSAILVKSAAGADINLDNVDIYGVVADPINHVWVDEASKAYADLVIVNGGRKIVEGEPTVISSKTELENVLKNSIAGVTVKLSGADFGTVEISGELNDVIIEGSPDSNVRFNILSGAILNDFTFKSLDVEYVDSSSAYVDGGVINIDAGAVVKNLVIEDCVFNGSGGRSCVVGISEPSAEVTIKNSEINGPKYVAYASAPIAKFTMDNCEVTGISSWLVMMNAGDSVGAKLTITGCDFTDCTGGIAKYLGSTQPEGASTVFTKNTLVNCKGHDGSDAKWFTIPGAVSTITVFENTLDGAAWTPSTAQGLGK